MDSGRQPVPGEVVYLVGEIAVGGQIFEIGARALVTDAREDELAIELGGETVACRPELVVRKRLRAPRSPSWQSRPSRLFRPAPQG